MAWLPSSAPQSSYHVEKNVVEARGRGLRLAPGGAARPLPQPASPYKSEQHQHHEEEEGTTNHGWHRCGHCPVPCGPQGM